jgi:hypothetical protein
VSFSPRTTLSGRCASSSTGNGVSIINVNHGVDDVKSNIILRTDPISSMFVLMMCVQARLRRL